MSTIERESDGGESPLPRVSTSKALLSREHSRAPAGPEMDDEDKDGFPSQPSLSAMDFSSHENSFYASLCVNDRRPPPLMAPSSLTQYNNTCASALRTKPQPATNGNTPSGSPAGRDVDGHASASPAGMSGSTLGEGATVAEGRRDAAPTLHSAGAGSHSSSPVTTLEDLLAWRQQWREQATSPTSTTTTTATAALSAASNPSSPAPLSQLPSSSGSHMSSALDAARCASHDHLQTHASPLMPSPSSSRAESHDSPRLPCAGSATDRRPSNEHPPRYHSSHGSSTGSAITDRQGLSPLMMHHSSDLSNVRGRFPHATADISTAAGVASDRIHRHHHHHHHHRHSKDPLASEGNATSSHTSSRSAPQDNGEEDTKPSRLAFLPWHYLKLLLKELVSIFTSEDEDPTSRVYAFIAFVLFFFVIGYAVFA